MDDAQIFGNHIRELRLDRNLSQRELAKKAEMDFTYLSKIENGKMPPPREDVIQRLAAALGADFEEFLAFARKTPPATAETIQRSPTARRFFFRHAMTLSEDDWKDLIEHVQKRKREGK